MRWIEGGATDIGTPEADLAIMTGHVAQFFLTDASWREALLGLRRALHSGGRLAFETRNPAAREWERWTSDWRRSVEDPAVGLIERWSEVHEAASGMVSFAIHNRFVNSGDVLVSELCLRFRTEDELVASLEEAGFSIERTYGDWDRRPLGPESREIIVVAVRTR